MSTSMKLQADFSFFLFLFVQTGVSSRRGIQQQSASFWHRLMGASGSLEQSIKSPYTSRTLKPFIR